MNSTITKTFRRCLEELLFLRYEKIPKKAVKLDSFLQCSVHIFLGQDDCVWKINLRVLSIHILKNFPCKVWSMWQHHIPLKHYLLKTLSNCQTFALLTVGFFTFNVLEFIHKLIIELHALQCLFVRRYNKKKKGGGEAGLFQISQKERLFHHLWQPRSLGKNLIMWPSSPLQFGQEENICRHSVERRAYWFILKVARMFLIPTCRNRIVNTLVIVTITPTCKRLDIG